MTTTVEAPQGERMSRALRRFTWAGLTAYALLSVYTLRRCAILTPFSDEFDWIRRWYELQWSGDWAVYLFAPINFHRLPLIFGLLAVDIQVLDGTNLPLIASGAAALAAMAWLLARQAARATTSALAAPAFAAAAMLSLMASSVLDAAIPINTNYIHGAVLAVAAIVVAEDADTPSGWRRSLALALAVLAGFGDAAALAVFPALALSAFRRRDWLWLTAVLAVGALDAAIYLQGQLAAGGAVAGEAMSRPLDAMRLGLSFLALPWGRGLGDHAWMVGAPILTLAITALTRCGGAGASRAQRAGCTLIAFTLAAAVMAGVGRSGLANPADAPLRYAVLVTPLHVGLLILALPHAERLWRANRAAAVAGSAGLLAGLCLQNLLLADRAIQAADSQRALIADFKAGRREPLMQVMIHPKLTRAERIYRRLRQDGRFQLGDER